jgi:hypothetical protein
MVTRNFDGDRPLGKNYMPDGKNFLFGEKKDFGAF